MPESVQVCLGDRKASGDNGVTKKTHRSVDAVVGFHVPVLAYTMVCLAEGDARHAAGYQTLKNQSMFGFQVGMNFTLHVSIGMKQPKKDSAHGRASGADGAVTKVESAKVALNRLTQSLTSFWSTMEG